MRYLAASEKIPLISAGGPRMMCVFMRKHAYENVFCIRFNRAYRVQAW